MWNIVELFMVKKGCTSFWKEGTVIEFHHLISQYQWWKFHTVCTSRMRDKQIDKSER